jgi:hypothetical protein
MERSPAVHAKSRSAPGPPGRDERWGLGGHVEAPNLYQKLRASIPDTYVGWR